MYSTHSDFTRTTRSRVGSVYLSVPKDRNGAGGGGPPGGGTSVGARLQRTSSTYSPQGQGQRPSPNRLAPPNSANGNGFDAHD